MPPPKPIDPSQIGVLNLLDPYLTTYNKEHKKWKKWHNFKLKKKFFENKNFFFHWRDQWQGIAKKDAVTIYDTEEATKAWGFGTKTNPIPIDEVARKNLPMRDEIWFKSETKQRAVHCPPPRVPHTWKFFTVEIRL